MLYCFIALLLSMTNSKYLQLNDIAAYKVSFQLSNFVWSIVINWKPFEKDTVGKQFVRAVDSISANIAEGFGRYSKKDKINFYRYAYGSIKESLDWNQKSKMRHLLQDAEYARIHTVLSQLPKDLHHLINYTKEKLTI